MIMITPAEFEDEMRKIAETKSSDDRHILSDELMCKVLIDNGYVAGVEIFRQMEKSYS